MRSIVLTCLCLSFTQPALGKSSPITEPTATTMTSVRLPPGDGPGFHSAMLSWNRALPPASAASSLPTVLARPVDIGRLTSGFGVRVDPFDGSLRTHRGIDIAGRHGSPVRASADGLVMFAGQAGGYGGLVQINHGDGVQTRYGHLSRELVRSGTFVREGEIVGLMGSTGRSTGSHLHFEVRVGGQAVDPRLPVEGSSDVAAWDDALPPPPVTLHWPGWRTSSDRLPSAF